MAGAQSVSECSLSLSLSLSDLPPPASSPPLLPLSSLPVVEAQNLLTGEVLAQCDTREPFRQLFTQLYDYAKYGTPFKRGGACEGGRGEASGEDGGTAPRMHCGKNLQLGRRGKERGGRRQLVMPIFHRFLHPSLCPFIPWFEFDFESCADRYYYYYNSGLQQQYVLYSQSSLDAPASVLIDPNTLSTDGTVSLKVRGV